MSRWLVEHGLYQLYFTQYLVGTKGAEVTDMRSLTRHLLAVTLAGALAACASNDNATMGKQAGSGGERSSGGASAGGASADGGASGGASAGGTGGTSHVPTSGGSPATGGSSNGTASGGAAAGGAPAGGAANGGASSGGSGGATTACKGASITKTDGRPTGATCHPTRVQSFPDAGVPCTTSAPCTYGTCVKGECTIDECLVDSDCAAGSACICGDTFYGGNALHGNVCVTAKCRTNADCGSSGVCEPSFGERCGGPSGVFCHSAADTCGTDKDCCPSAPACRYQAELGHWACLGISVCNG